MNPTHTTDLDLDVEVTPAVLLRRAAAYLARHGWTQYDMFDETTSPTPAACTYGAVKMAVSGDRIAAYTTGQAAAVNRAIRVLAGYLDTVFYIWGINQYGEAAEPLDVVVEWNDDPDRTAGQIIDVLNDAADDWDNTHPTPPTGQTNPAHQTEQDEQTSVGGES